jgi:hypothetical protein
VLARCIIAEARKQYSAVRCMPAHTLKLSGRIHSAQTEAYNTAMLLVLHSTSTHQQQHVPSVQLPLLQ